MSPEMGKGAERTRVLDGPSMGLAGSLYRVDVHFHPDDALDPSGRTGDPGRGIRCSPSYRLDPVLRGIIDILFPIAESVVASTKKNRSADRLIMRVAVYHAGRSGGFDSSSSIRSVDGFASKEVSTQRP